MTPLESLKPWNSFTPRKGPLLIIVMDGVGIGEKNHANAVYEANTPNLDALLASPLKTELYAHGTMVGAPSDDDMGNSEVGHNAIGSGRIFNQGAKLVNASLASKDIYKNKHWKQAVSDCLGDQKGTLHFIGLLSDGNVHSHIDHLFQLLTQATVESIKKVCVHPLLDGRDVYEKSSKQYLEKLENKLKECNEKTGGDYRIASGGGRMVVTMDRYNANWGVVKTGWDAHVHGIGRPFHSAVEAVDTFYKEDSTRTDQYLPSFVVVDQNKEPVGKIKDGDAVIFFNFRGDRAIEISRAFEEESLDTFDRGKIPKIHFAGMMQYDGDLLIPKHYLVDPPKIERTFCEYLLQKDLPLFAVSETQKFGHVTYFWNGNRSGYLNPKLEKYIEIPSDKIEFDKAPEMKAAEIADETIRLLKSGEFRLGRINLANGDMVGHTGNFDATVKAMESVDLAIGRILEEVKAQKGIAIVTADHGNADLMFNEKKGMRLPVTSHTLNRVPFCIYDPEYHGEYKMATLPKAGLANIASTSLNLLGFGTVKDYEPSLIVLPN